MTGPKERTDTYKVLNTHTFIFCLQEYRWSAIEKVALEISGQAHMEAQAVPRQDIKPQYNNLLGGFYAVWYN